MGIEHANSGERGFSLLETVVAVCILGAVSIVAIPQGIKLFRTAVIDYEAQCLAGDLQLLQRMSVTSGYNKMEMPIEDGSDDGLQMQIRSAGYYQIRNGKKEIVKYHEFDKNIRVAITKMSDVGFERTGMTKSSLAGSVYLYWRQDTSLRRRIVLTNSGRIRVER